MSVKPLIECMVTGNSDVPCLLFKKSTEKNLFEKECPLLGEDCKDWSSQVSFLVALNHQTSQASTRQWNHWICSYTKPTSYLYDKAELHCRESLYSQLHPLPFNLKGKGWSWEYWLPGDWDGSMIVKHCLYSGPGTGRIRGVQGAVVKDRGQ